VIALVRFLYLLALALWIGEVAFFSFVGAPAIFRVLGAARAGDVVSAIFPRYYALGAASATTAAACALALARRAAAPRWWLAALCAVALGLAATAWAGAIVHPRAQRLRAAAQVSGGQASDSEAFRQAHRLAVMLNGTALLAGLAALGLSAVALRH
jgi:hypothetical protein